MAIKEKTLERYNTILKLIKEGMSVKDACKKVGMVGGHYYALRKRLSQQKSTSKRKYTKRPKMDVLPIPNGTPTFAIQGSPEEIARFMREVSRRTW